MSSSYGKADYESLNLRSGTRGIDSPEVPGRRLYDVCMVFQYKTSKRVRFEERDDEYYNVRALDNPSEADKAKMQMWKQHRESILKSLQNCGLHLFCFYSRDRDQILVKIGASAQKLRDTAARKRYKLQMKKEYLSAYAEFRHDYPGRPEFRFNDRRIISHIYQTHTEDALDGSSIFKISDKIDLLHHIIQSKDKDCAGINPSRLLHQGELKAYFPIHDAQGIEKIKEFQWKWFWPDEEHANRLRDYFGDKIAFYFLWMAFYLKWLMPLAALGLFLQFIDWCARTPDNPTAIPFCVLMSVWCLALPHFWRRQEAKYAISWGSLDLVEQLEPHRPEHWGEQLINPVTSQVEPHYPLSKRIFKYLISMAAMSLAGCVCVLCILVLLLIRHNIKSEVHHHIVGFQIAIAAYVEISNAGLDLLTRILTDHENHRTQTEYETAFLWKGAVLKYMNSFFALYYVAFFKEHQTLFSEPMECLRDQCLLDMQAQLGIFVLFRLLVSNVFEHYYPKVRLWLRTFYYDNASCMSYMHGQTLELAEMSATEQQAKKERHRNFQQFDEMLLTHGFATLFAVTSPWVCTATLLAVIVEIWVDMKSLLESRQRPFPERARNNEPWGVAFEVYGVLAALTNVLLLIYTSTQYSGWTATEKIVFFVFHLEEMPPRGVILPKWVATEFAHFCCRYLISGYHDTLILTNLGALTWEACLPLAFLYSDQDTSKRAGLVFLSAVGNFYAAATTRFNDSGFTSGLSFLLPPFFCYNFLLIYVLGPPTMILGGVICGRAIVLTQGLGPAVIGGTGLVVVGWFFRDVHEWMPFLGWMGGAGSSEGFDSSFLRAGLYPATFAVAFVLAELTASLFSHWLLQSCGIACVIMVFAYQAKVRLVCFP